MKVDVLLAGNTSITKAILHNTKDIPVVFILAPEPVEDGLVVSLSRPGGNATGFTNGEASIAGKRLELLKRLSPDLKTVLAFLDQSGETWRRYLSVIGEAARSLGIGVTAVNLQDAATMERAAAELSGRHGGMIVPSSSGATRELRTLTDLSRRYRLPAIYPYKYFADGGGLMSYGIPESETYRNAADYIDRILKGAKPSDLPVQQPTKFEFVINLNVAKSMELDVPATLLAIADEVIE